MDALGTVAAVFGAGSAFDIAEGTKLNCARVMMLSVDPLRFKHQIWQGLGVNLTDTIDR